MAGNLHCLLLFYMPMTYYEKYHCINCPVDKFCGTVVSATRLCNSYNEETNGSDKAHTLVIYEKEND